MSLDMSLILQFVQENCSLQDMSSYGTVSTADGVPRRVAYDDWAARFAAWCRRRGARPVELPVTAEERVNLFWKFRTLYNHIPPVKLEDGTSRRISLIIGMDWNALAPRPVSSSQRAFANSADSGTSEFEASEATYTEAPRAPVPAPRQVPGLRPILAKRPSEAIHGQLQPSSSSIASLSSSRPSSGSRPRPRPLAPRPETGPKARTSPARPATPEPQAQSAPPPQRRRMDVAFLLNPPDVREAGRAGEPGLACQPGFPIGPPRSAPPRKRHLDAPSEAPRQHRRLSLASNGGGAPALGEDWSDYSSPPASPLCPPEESAATRGARIAALYGFQDDENAEVNLDRRESSDTVSFADFLAHRETGKWRPAMSLGGIPEATSVLRAGPAVGAQEGARLLFSLASSFGRC
eukprot:tig00000194_g14759.t1